VIEVKQIITVPAYLLDGLTLRTGKKYAEVNIRGKKARGKSESINNRAFLENSERFHHISRRILMAVDGEARIGQPKRKERRGSLQIVIFSRMPEEISSIFLPVAS
jgi:hypothetical protein